MEFCPQCGDKSFNLIEHIQKPGEFIWYCSVCENLLTTDEFKKTLWANHEKEKLYGSGTFCDKKTIGKGCHCKKCRPEEWGVYE